MTRPDAVQQSLLCGCGEVFVPWCSQRLDQLRPWSSWWVHGNSAGQLLGERQDELHRLPLQVGEWAMG